MFRFQSEQERETFREQHLQMLLAKTDDLNLKPNVRLQYSQMLKDCLEDQQVEALYVAVESHPNPQISNGTDPLIKTFMNERAELLSQEKEPQSIGTPVDFFEWLFNKPRFK
ncbi:MAG: hypothetical protein BGO21_08545 [Dyadobacter sp. 50-39]|uniref:hypothetical protein n=1 Tax=Dyadobacter sp. 50-39 TaxID=1895756 RepID=UPI00096424DC|nr:hypothetical protein [Dyadobacter sp. 50-39]OJV19295.1 MAG: hypothetical protein BGO21_08545 [Dyadobacter sp. 50-39]